MIFVLVNFTPILSKLTQIYYFKIIILLNLWLSEIDSILSIKLIFTQTSVVTISALFYSDFCKITQGFFVNFVEDNLLKLTVTSSITAKMLEQTK